METTKPETKRAARERERREAADMLRKWLKPGDTVWCVLRHVSKSGMRRRIDLYKLEDNGRLFLTGYAARVLGMRWDDRDGGIIVDGCGMDMGFHLVSNLSATLYPAGFGCIGETVVNGRSIRCPSNDHSNGDRDYTPHNAALVAEIASNGVKSDAGNHWHQSGDYALRSEWL